MKYRSVAGKRCLNRLITKYPPDCTPHAPKAQKCRSNTMLEGHVKAQRREDRDLCVFAAPTAMGTRRDRILGWSLFRKPLIFFVALSIVLCSCSAAPSQPASVLSPVAPQIASAPIVPASSSPPP